VSNPLDELRAEYRRELPAKLEKLNALWSARQLPELHRALHTLAGSAGTFGLRELGESAREAETYLDACGPALDASQQVGLQRLLEAIYSGGASAR
jgi:HPt (histidine-containing phosphotransfer) domain-containing protein